MCNSFLTKTGNTGASLVVEHFRSNTNELRAELLRAEFRSQRFCFGVSFSTFILVPSRVVGSSLQYLCKEYLKAVVHQEFNDIDSDSGTYSDANGIKKLPLLPRQLVKQGGSKVKLWRVPLFWLACAHNLLLNVKFSPFCFARVFFKIFNHSCSCSSCIRRNFCGGAGDCGEHGRVGLT